MKTNENPLSFCYFSIEMVIECFFLRKISTCKHRSFVIIVILKTISAFSPIPDAELIFKKLQRKIVESIYQYWVNLINFEFSCKFLNNFFRYLFFTVPPTKIEIFNDQGFVTSNNVIGPYREGSSVNITCMSTGGKHLMKNELTIVVIQFFYEQ